MGYFLMTSALRRSTGLFIFVGVLSISVAVVFVFLSTDELEENVTRFYQGELRASLFVGLITVSAFMFSLKTFIVVNMKENVYDKDYYKNMITERKKLDPSITIYGPLKNFSDLLFWSVLISLIAAVGQFTIGLIPSIWATALSLSLAGWSIVLIFISLLYMQSNLKTWFELLEGD